MKKLIIAVILFLPIYITAQSNVNPDISLIGSFNTYTNFINGSPEKGKLNFEHPSLEMFVDGYLNPFARASANIAYEEGEFAVEELYANIVRGLPLDMQLKAGKFLVGFGKLNTVHAHIWPFLDRPLYHQIYFGHEGFNDIGVNASFILPTESFYSSFDLGIYKGDAIGKTEAEDPESGESINELRGINPIVVGRLGTFFQLSDFDNLEIGLSGSYGVHAIHNFNLTGNDNSQLTEKSLDYFYGGIDFKFKHKPDAYTSLTIQGEALLNNRKVVRENGFGINSIIEIEESISTWGAFFYVDYQFAKQYSIGVKYDFTYGIIGDLPASNTLTNDDQNKTFGYSAWLGYYPVEETLAIRFGVQNLSFSYADGTKRGGETTLKLQMIFSLGPHKVHPF